MCFIIFILVTELVINWCHLLYFWILWSWTPGNVFPRMPGGCRRRETLENHDMFDVVRQFMKTCLFDNFVLWIYFSSDRAQPIVACATIRIDEHNDLPLFRPPMAPQAREGHRQIPFTDQTIQSSGMAFCLAWHF